MASGAWDQAGILPVFIATSLLSDFARAWHLSGEAKDLAPDDPLQLPLFDYQSGPGARSIAERPLVGDCVKP